MLFAVINRSTMVSDDECHIMAGAVQKQVAEDIAPVWNRLSLGVCFYPRDKEINIPPFAFPVGIFDDADQSGVLGYHFMSGAGQVIARVFARPIFDDGGTAFTLKAGGCPTVSTTLSHEIGEALVDETCSVWVDGPKTEAGSCYALEISDACEADGYNVSHAGNEVAVSNFLFPAAFNMNASVGSRFDFLDKTKGPFEMTPGGYMLVRTVPGLEQTIFATAGDMHGESKRHLASRTYKRLKGKL